MTAGAPDIVLIVEDDQATSTLLATTARGLWRGHPVCAEVRTLAEAQALVQNLVPDLVILDLYLPDSPTPGSPGWDTLDALIPLLPPLIPVIVLSGYYAWLEGGTALGRGAFAFLPKDGHCTPAVLVETLSSAWALAQGLAVRQAKGLQRPSEPLPARPLL